MLRGHESVREAVFSGSWLVTAGGSSVRLWDWDVDVLLDRARRLAGRPMTDYERQYLPRYATGMDLDEEVDETAFSNVIFQQDAVPDTEDWQVLIQDNFARSEIGEQWEVVSGEWSIEGGRLVGTLTSPAALDRSQAEIKWARGKLPQTLEIEYDTLGSADVSSGLKLLSQDLSKGYIAALCGFPHPALVRNGRKGTGPLLWVMNPVNRYLHTFIADAPRFEHKPDRRHRFRVLREPNRITLFVDGEQVVSERVTELDGSVLQLNGFGKTQDRVYFENLRVRVPND